MSANCKLRPSPPDSVQSMIGTRSRKAATASSFSSAVCSPENTENARPFDCKQPFDVRQRAAKVDEDQQLVPLRLLDQFQQTDVLRGLADRRGQPRQSGGFGIRDRDSLQRRGHGHRVAALRGEQAAQLQPRNRTKPFRLSRRLLERLKHSPQSHPPHFRRSARFRSPSRCPGDARTRSVCDTTRLRPLRVWPSTVWA